MGEYKSLYEKYYKNVKSKGPGKAPIRYNSLDGYSGGGGSASGGNIPNLGQSLIKKFTLQLGGAFILLVAVLGLKYMPIEGADRAYTVSKEAVDKSFDIEQVAEAFNITSLEDYKEEALDYIDKFKSVMTGEKTLKETIKEDYIVPVVGTYSSIEGENIGVAIQVKEDSDIVASYDGTVREVKEDNDGTHVLIDNGNGVETYYGLLSSASVQVDDKIKKGDILGKSGVIDSAEKKGIVYKLIYMGAEKNPAEYMDFSSLQNV